ncbi:MAG: dihydroorotate dehydrogenase electron transfer subunit [Candidatus Omnitrophota bacterium]
MESMIKAGAPKELTARVKKVNEIKPDVFLLSFDSAYISKNSQPGQFLHIKIIKTILRRPFSIHCLKGKTVFILFRIRGRGTKILSGYKAGDKLNIIGPLGNGFCLNGKAGKNILLAGGLGVAPLVFLADKLKKTKTAVILGAKNDDEVLCLDAFKKRGCKVMVATEDGSDGHQGIATELLERVLDAQDRELAINIYSCGPEAMFKQMKKVIKRAGNKKVNCQVSFEQFMGCGLGVCCGCSIKTKSGYKKVCKEGPVFKLNEVL